MDSPYFVITISITMESLWAGEGNLFFRNNQLFQVLHLSDTVKVWLRPKRGEMDMEFFFLERRNNLCPFSSEKKNLYVFLAQSVTFGWLAIFIFFWQPLQPQKFFASIGTKNPPGMSFFCFSKGSLTQKHVAPSDVIWNKFHASPCQQKKKERKSSNGRHESYFKRHLLAPHVSM